MTRWLVIIGFAVGPISCSSDAFFCAKDGQCVQGEVRGTCQVSGVCSFPDSDCDSGHRFGEFAGAVANMCVPEDAGTSSGAESTGSSGGVSPAETSAAETLGAADDGTTDATVSTTANSGVDSDGSESSSSGSDGSDGSSGSSGGSSSSTGGTTTGDQGLPDGSVCAVASDCASGHCATQGALGSICSECTTDADCEWGCGPPNPFSRPVAPGQCGDGALGAACEANESCDDALTCSVFLDVPGIGTFAGCGECTPEGPSCPMGQICNVSLDLPDAAGHHECVSPGSVPNGASCTLGAAFEACDMFCESVQIEGLVAIGICGECLSDDDCLGPGICISGSVQFPGGSLIHSSCS